MVLQEDAIRVTEGEKAPESFLKPPGLSTPWPGPGSRYCSAF